MNEALHDLSVSLAFDQDENDWNNFVSRHPKAVPQGFYQWRRVLERSYNLQTNFLICRSKKMVCGVLPAYSVGGKISPRRMYVVRSGFWATSPSVYSVLFQVLQEQAKNQGIEAIEIEANGMQFQEARWKPSLASSFILPLSNETQMWAELPAKTRNMIRKARKSGIVVSAENNGSDSLYVQYRENMVRLGVGLHTKEFFDIILEEFRSQSKVLIAHLDGVPVASMLLLHGTEVAAYPVQNALFQYRNYAPIQLLTWEAMKQAKCTGAGFLDMGASRIGSNVFGAKKNFGATPLPLYKISLEIQQKKSLWACSVHGFWPC